MSLVQMGIQNVWIVEKFPTRVDVWNALELLGHSFASQVFAPQHDACIVAAKVWNAYVPNLIPGAAERVLKQDITVNHEVTGQGHCIFVRSKVYKNVVMYFYIRQPHGHGVDAWLATLPRPPPAPPTIIQCPPALPEPVFDHVSEDDITLPDRFVTQLEFPYLEDENPDYF